MSAHASVRNPVVPVPLSKVERDLRLSEGLLIAGIALYGVFGLLFWTGVLTTSGSTDFQTQVLVSQVIGGTAGVLTFVGALFTAINWSLVRARRTPASP